MIYTLILMNKRAIIVIGVIIVILISGVFVWKTTKHTEPTNKITTAKKVKPLPKKLLLPWTKTASFPKQSPSKSAAMSVGLTKVVSRKQSIPITIPQTSYIEN